MTKFPNTSLTTGEISFGLHAPHPPKRNRRAMALFAGFCMTYVFYALEVRVALGIVLEEIFRSGKLFPGTKTLKYVLL